MDKIEAKIRKVFQKNPEREFSPKQIKKQLSKQRLTKESVKRVLNYLHGRGVILKTKQGGYKASAKALKNQQAKDKKNKPLLIGKVDRTRSGDAYIIIEGRDDDVFVSSKFLMNAFEGDTVAVQVTRKGRNGKRDGKVTKIVKRANQRLVGSLQKRKYGFTVEPDRKDLEDFIVNISKARTAGAKVGEKVIVNMLEWGEYPEGEVIEVLGKPGTNEVAMKSILVEHGFDLEFSAETMHEADSLDASISDEEIAKRRDFRETLTFTIDPVDAKDFDDALSLKKLENGHWEVGIHIADVSHYVRPGTAMEKDAADRATSVYLVDRVLPMLPESLSNVVCSLRPHEEKLCFSAVFEMDEKGKVYSEWFGRTVIFSDHRFTYEGAQEVIDGAESPYSEELKVLNTIAEKLRAKRMKSGALAFESDEVRFVLDDKGKAVGVEFKVRKAAHMLVEDFMLLANRKVAAFVNKAQVPFVNREHESPNMDKLKQLQRFAKRFGYEIELTTPKKIAGSLNELLENVVGKPEENLFQTLVLRSMAKAKYSTSNKGHYGLGFANYTHFTSPIRRYPDVMVHRVLQQHLDGKVKLKKADLEENCVHSSQKERGAMKAEWASQAYKYCELLEDKVGEEYDGVISGVAPFGLFVQILENKAEGLIKTINLPFDKYNFDEEDLSLTGQSSGKVYSIGKAIRIQIAAVNKEEREIDFEIVD